MFLYSLAQSSQQSLVIAPRQLLYDFGGTNNRAHPICQFTEHNRKQGLRVDTGNVAVTNGIRDGQDIISQFISSPGGS